MIGLASLILIVLVLWDAFVAMLLPRRVSRGFRIARFFFVSLWTPWSAIARRIGRGKRREAFLSVFGPLSVLLLFMFWAVTLISSFALLQWSVGEQLNATNPQGDLGVYFYMSGVTFFTLGFGDVVPVDHLGRFLAVAEAGIGFGFLAVVISYLPVLYQAFSRREVTISLLDARAGSPPTAAQLLIRASKNCKSDRLGQFLEEWERWAAEVLESHISFPILSQYRSQHDNQSWLGGLTTILDVSALVIAGMDDIDPYQAQLTFAMSRHTVVDLAQAFRVPPIEPDPSRLSVETLAHLRAELRAVGITPRDDAAADRKLTELRGMYEPFVNALSRYFLLTLPAFSADKAPVDNWQTSAWMKRTRGMMTLAIVDQADDHVD